MSPANINMRNGCFLGLVVTALVVGYRVVNIDIGTTGTTGDSSTQLAQLEGRVLKLEAKLATGRKEVETAKIITNHVIGVIKEDLQSSYGLDQQGELLMKIANEVKKIQKVQIAGMKHRRTQLERAKGTFLVNVIEVYTCHTRVDCPMQRTVTHMATLAVALSIPFNWWQIPFSIAQSVASWPLLFLALKLQTVAPVRQAIHRWLTRAYK